MADRSPRGAAKSRAKTRQRKAELMKRAKEHMTSALKPLAREEAQHRRASAQKSIKQAKKTRKKKGRGHSGG